MKHIVRHADGRWRLYERTESVIPGDGSWRIVSDHPTAVAAMAAAPDGTRWHPVRDRPGDFQSWPDR